MGKKTVLGAGSVAALAGAYYLLGPNGKAHRKKAVELASKIKKEVRSEIKKAKEITAPLYYKAVDVVSDNYAKQYEAHQKDIKAFAAKLKEEWRDAKKMAGKKLQKSIRIIKNKV